MKNFAMLYKMKEALQDFWAAYNQLDPAWQEWLRHRGNIEVQEIIETHNRLEDLEMDDLDIEPFEVEGILDIRQDRGHK